MANKTQSATSAVRSASNDLGRLEGWVACLIVWAACIGMALSIACFMLEPAE
jgi:hypothetical protein